MRSRCLIGLLACAALLPPVRAATAPPLSGDLNGDGKVDVTDAVAVLRISVGSLVPTDLQKAAGDVNGDGKIDVTDAIRILRAAVNLEPLPTRPAPTLILETSPASGAADVAVKRETIFRLSNALAPTAVVDGSNLFAEFAGKRIPAAPHVSPDRKTLTLFYTDPAGLPPSARIHVTLIGDKLPDVNGRPIDADGDGLAGGTGSMYFDTLSLTTLPNTSVSGRVFAADLAAGMNTPLAGVTITVDGADQTMRTATDKNGDFRLSPAPAGSFFVHIDGRTATNGVPSGAYYPMVGKLWASTPGQETNIGSVYLPLIAAGTLQPVSQTQDTEIRLPASVTGAHPEFKDVKVVVPADSLYSEDGTRGGMAMVGIAPVPPDRLPGPLPEGLSFPMVITVQSTRTNFDVPAPVCFPNLADPDTGQPLAAGAPSALWSYNHKSGQWEMIGPMTVTADGKQVCTNPGVGILAPGWHGNNPRCKGKHGGADPCEGLQDLQKSALANCSVSGLLSIPKLAPGLGCALGAVQNLLFGINDCFIDSGGCLQTIGLNIVNTGLGCIPFVGGFLASAMTCLQASVAGSDLADCLAKNPALVKGGSRPLQAVPAAYADFGPPQHGQTRPPVDTARVLTDMRSQARIAADTMAFETALLGSPKWAQVGTSSADQVDPAAQIAKITAFFQALSTSALPASPGGKRITADERTALLQLPLPPSLSAADAAAVVDRYDRLAGGDLSGFDVAALRAAATQLQGTLQAVQAAGWQTMFDGLFSGATQTYLLADEKLGGAAPLAASLYYRLTDLRSGIVLRGRTNNLGTFDDLNLKPSTFYSLFYVVPGTLQVASTIFESDVAGTTIDLPRGVLGNPDPKDTDGDGLPDEVEAILGTDPNNASTCGNGLKDGESIAEGIDPSKCKPAATGIITAVDTPGIPSDVATSDDLAIVAEGDAGVSVFNVFNRMDPKIIAQVPTTAPAQAVAASSSRIAVAEGAGGLAVIDASDPANVTTAHQLDLGGSARAVATAGDIAFVGLDTGAVVEVDLVSGTVMDQVNLGAGVNDVAVAGDILFALRQDRLQSYSFVQGVLHPIGAAVPSGFGPETYTGRRRLFVGGGIAYVTSYPGYDTFDVRDPAKMTQLAAARDVGPNSFKQIVPNGSGLGLAAVGAVPRDDGQNHVTLYDVHDPTVNTANLTVFDTPGIARAVSIYNGFAYVGDSMAIASPSSKLEVINYLPADLKGVPPAITLSTSFAGGQVGEGEFIRVTANATDDVQVRNVEFYLDGVKVATAGHFPFEFRFITPFAAQQTSFRLRARASDTGGNFTWSAEQVVRIVPDTGPLRVVRTLPGANATVVPAPTVAAYFSRFLQPATVTTQSFQLISAGPDGVLGTADDRPVPGAQVASVQLLKKVVLSVPQPLQPGLYRATLQPPLADLGGNLLPAPYAWTFRVIDASRAYLVDSDGDGWTDEEETATGSDPFDPLSIPQLIVVAEPPIAALRADAATAGGLPEGLILAGATVDVAIEGDKQTIARPPVTVEIRMGAMASRPQPTPRKVRLRLGLPVRSANSRSPAVRARVRTASLHDTALRPATYAGSPSGKEIE